MTALRLAEHVAHTTDVDGMLESMTHEQFAEWCAKDQIEPLGYPTQINAVIAYTLISWLSGDDAPAPEQFMPWLKDAKRKPGTKALKTVLGVK